MNRGTEEQRTEEQKNVENLDSDSFDEVIPSVLGAPKFRINCGNNCPFIKCLNGVHRS